MKHFITTDNVIINADFVVLYHTKQDDKNQVFVACELPNRELGFPLWSGNNKKACEIVREIITSFLESEDKILDLRKDLDELSLKYFITERTV